MGFFFVILAISLEMQQVELAQARLQPPKQGILQN
jgi:hypothetical protein